MEWQLVLVIILGSLLFLMATGTPVAFCFLVISIVGSFLFLGGEAGLRNLPLSMFSSLANIALMPLALFILMGEVMFHSGIAPKMIGTLDKWLGRMPGRLGLLSVAAGTAIATVSGSSMASVAILGSVLVPETEKRGYKKPMSLGPILGSGGLAVMIPPTGQGVFLAVIAQVSIGKLLIAIIIPGLLMAVLYAAYIITRCRLQPSIAPPYDVPTIPILGKLVETVRYILPLAFVVFAVVGVIFLGIASPTEAAATGAMTTLILAAVYKRLNWSVLKKSFGSAAKITVMMLLIIASASAFSQILAASGATRGLVAFATGLPVAPILIVMGMQVVLLILGMFMTSVAMVMICIPIFMPVIYAFGFDPIWFATIVLLNQEMAVTSPPFGVSLFVMKGVAPPDTTMGDVYRAALPFLGCDLIVMALLITFPSLVFWLPGLMQ